MTRCDIFTFRISQDERRLISALAERLQRTQSDAVRFVVINAARELAAQSDLSLPFTQVQGLQDEIPSK